MGKKIRFRINNKELPDKPDIVIKKYTLPIFIDGEFWLAIVCKMLEIR